MSTAALRLSYQSLSRKVTKATHFGLPWKAMYALVAIFFAVMLMFYILRVDELTRGAFLIKNYNSKISALTSENGNLQTTFAQSGFLQGAQQKAYALNFEKTAQVTYVQMLQKTLAEAK